MLACVGKLVIDLAMRSPVRQVPGVYPKVFWILPAETGESNQRPVSTLLRHIWSSNSSH
jgi:hypothetical protein